VMSTRLETVELATPLAEVLPLLESGMVPIVCEGDRFLGLITRIDLINYLRRGVH
jgi:cystathionine beta-synthase